MSEDRDDKKPKPFKGARISNGPEAGPIETLRKIWKVYRNKDS